MAKKPRRGRPPLKPDNRRSYKLSVTIREKLRRQLEESAAAEDRTLSQEVEFRIERSFDRAELIFNSMTLAYGPELAGLVILVARAMAGAGRVSRRKESGLEFSREGWLTEPFAYEQALHAAVAVLKGLRPTGRANAPSGDPRLVESMNVLMKTSRSSSWGEWYGKNVLDALRGEGSIVNSDEWLERVKEMLGPVAARISQKSESDE